MRKLFFAAAGIFMLTAGLKAQVAVSELNYHSDSLNSSGDWIELHNYGASDINIGGWTLKDGNNLNPAYTFAAGTVLQAGQFVVLAENPTKFSAVHPGISYMGPLPFEFSNKSEQITLRDNASTIKVQFTYGDSVPWSKCADGLGRTLQIISPAANPDDPASWRCGCVLGSPGADFQPCSGETVVVSEINYHSSPSADAGDWIELRNLSNSGINISGWKIRDKNEYNIYTFPSATILNPLGRLVVYQDDALFSARHPSVLNKTGPLGFGFSANGDGIRIYDASEKIRYATYYNDNILWPQGADGNGYTLELDTAFDSAGDVCAPQAWFDGCPEGSPGKQFVLCPGFSTEEAVPVSLSVFPNPATAYVQIEATFPLTGVSLINPEGKILQYVPATKGQPVYIPTGGQAPGLYYLRIESGRDIQVRPLVISH